MSTPVASGPFMSAADGTPLADSTLYRCLVGSLQYLTLTRSDISYIVHQVYQFMQTRYDTHLTVVKRIFRYLNGTLNIGLHYVRTPIHELYGFYDADWAYCRDDKCSTTGFAIFFGDNLIS
jgi:hypothetical protein